MNMSNKRKSCDWIESTSILHELVVTVHAVITSDACTVPYPTPFEMHSGSEMVKQENKAAAVVGRAEKDNRNDKCTRKQR